jgi:hypothetical protein
MKRYAPLLTADVNRKGVLDVDTVKGCAGGVAANGDRGCYGACYAEAIARFRGLKFAEPVTRKVTTRAQAKQIETAVKAAPQHFFRVGTMGDPSHDWSETAETVEWLSAWATPIIVTKHWQRASDEQLRRLANAGAVLNTSVSALDTTAQLAHRERQISRYMAAGGHSVARVVSCDFTDTADGRAMASIQRRLLSTAGAIDNPLRISAAHPLARDGVVALKTAIDIRTRRTISIASETAYVGHCATCPDQCGMASMPSTIGHRVDLFQEKAA